MLSTFLLIENKTYDFVHIHIAFQMEEHFKELEGPFGEEFESICKLGRLTHDAWMREAVGSPLSAQPLLRAAGEALDALE